MISLHRGIKHICRYCLQDLGTKKVLKRLIKHCFQINGKQRIIIPKEASMSISEIMKEK